MTGTKIVPNVAKGWEISDDGKRTTLFLRKGMKWSDGAPFTADDFVFWFEDMYQNKELDPDRRRRIVVNGKPGRIVKVDETTVAFEFDEPYFLFPSQLAGDTQVGGGQSRLQSDERELGLYAPAHYLKQFLPKYSSVEALERSRRRPRASTTGCSMFKFKTDWRLNSGPADDLGLEDGAADQQPDLAAGAQPVLLGGRHRGQPAAVSSTRSS